MPKKLTDTAVKMAKPKERPYKLTDGGGRLVSPGLASATRPLSDIGLLNALRRMGMPEGR